MQSNVERGPWEQRPRSFEELAHFSPTRWTDTFAPSYDWVVDGCFLRGSVAILSGDGGLGKSLLLQQLLTASCCGSDWLGMRTAQCRSLAIFCEDDRDELHRRQERINDHYGCTMGDLEPVRMASLAWRDATMMVFEKWGANGRRQPFFDQIEEAAKNHKAEIIVLDTRADVFSGNEVDRNQPRVFIRELRKFALRIQGVIILTEHPSVEGLASGTGRSGSTGWNNSVRSRVYLTKQKPKKGEDEPPPNERILRTMKSNYSASGGKVELIWNRGVFERKPDQTTDTWWEDKE